MEPGKNHTQMKAKINERNRTNVERQEHCLRMSDIVTDYLRNHFKNGGTLAQLRNDGDLEKTPQIPGQHGSISIVRLPLPASEDGLFVIKDLGTPLNDDLGYTIEAKDLWVEASTISFLGHYTDIPVPWIYSSCAVDEKNPELSFFTMEYIEGTAYHAEMRLTDDQKNRIIRQMATIRIRMIENTSQAIGGMNWPIPSPKPKLPHPVGAMSGPRIWDDGRVRSLYIHITI